MSVPYDAARTTGESTPVNEMSDNADGDGNGCSTFDDLDIAVHDGEITYDEARRCAGKSITGYNAVWPTGDDRPGAQWKYLHAADLAGGGGPQGWAATREEAVEEIRGSIRHSWNFWQEKIRWLEAGDRTEERQQVIRCGGSHYVIGTETYTGMRGYGGAPWAFRLLAAGREIRSTNVWFQGEIPAEFRDRLPDNVERLPVEPTRTTATPAGGA